MALVNWLDIEATPEFQQASPADKEKIRQKYRNEYLPSAIPEGDLSAVHSAFDSRFKPYVTEEPGLLDRAGDLAGRFNRGVLGAASGVIQGAAIAGAAAEGFLTGETLAPNPEAMALADAINNNRFTQTRKEFDDSYISDVAGGLGSAVGMSTGGGLLGQGSRLIGSTAIGAAGMTSSAYDSARQKGATESEAQRLGLLNAPLGLTEALPVERLVSRIPGFDGAKNAFTQLLQSMGVAGAEEGLQEFGQNVASQALEVDAGLRKSIDWEDAGYNALVGIGAGTTLAGGTGLGALSMAARGQNPETSSGDQAFDAGKATAAEVEDIADRQYEAITGQSTDEIDYFTPGRTNEWTNDESTQQLDMFSRTTRGVGIQDMFSGNISSAAIPALEQSRQQVLATQEAMLREQLLDPKLSRSARIAIESQLDRVADDQPVRSPERQVELETAYLFDQQDRINREARQAELARREQALPAVNTASMGLDNIVREGQPRSVTNNPDQLRQSIAEQTVAELGLAYDGLGVVNAEGNRLNREELLLLEREVENRFTQAMLATQPVRGNTTMADAFQRAGVQRSTGLLEPTGFESEAFYPNATASAPVFTPARTIPVDQTAVQQELPLASNNEVLSQPDLFEAQQSQPSLFPETTQQPIQPEVTSVSVRAKPVAQRTPDGTDLIARVRAARSNLDMNAPMSASAAVDNISSTDFELGRQTSNNLPLRGPVVRLYESGNMTVGDVLDDVVNSNTYDKVPQTKALSGLVREMADRLQAMDVGIVKFDPKNPIHKQVADANNWSAMLDGNDKYMLQGAYIPQLDTIFINQDTPNLGVVLHEIRHAMTYGAIEMGKAGKLTGESAKAYNVLDNLFNQFKPDIQAAYDKARTAEGKTGPADVYALTNLHEFTSELYSNPKLREELRKIPISRSTARELSGITSIALSRLRNMYDATKSVIQKVLGLSEKADNALDVLAQADENFAKTITSEQRTSKQRGNAPRSVRSATPVPDLAGPTSGDTTGQPGQAEATVRSKAWNKLLKEFRSGGIASRKLNEIKDNFKGEAAANAAESLYSRANLDRILSKYPKEVSDKLNTIAKLQGAEQDAALGELGQRYPDVSQAYDSIRREIARNSLQIAELLLDSGQEVTEKDRAIISSILERMANNSYNTRTYKINAPKGEGKKWAQALARSGRLTAWGRAQADIMEGINTFAKKVGWDALGTTRAEDKRREQLVNNGVEFLMKNDLHIPDDLSNWVPGELTGAQRERLVNLHDAYIGGQKDYSEVSNATLISDLTDAKSYVDTKRVRNTAREMIVDLLRIGNKDNQFKIAAKYGGVNQDLGIITPRESVPPEISAMLGEYDSAVHNVFVTMVRQGEWTARQKMLREIQQNGEGTSFFDAKTRPPQATEQLRGKEYGNLQGMWTTPDLKNWLDGQAQTRTTIDDVMNSVLGEADHPIKTFGRWMMDAGVQKLSGLNKQMVTVFNLAGMLMNLAGSPVLLLRDGNFSPSAWAKGLKTSVQLINLARRGTNKEEVLELIRRGLLDSVQAGEVVNVELEQLAKDIVGEGWLKKGWGTGIAVLSDMFAISDAWTRVANYYKQKDFVRKVYAASNTSISEQEVERIAAERIRQTNMSYVRTPRAVKTVENTVSAFLPYIWETYRTTGTGMKMVVDDFARSKQTDNPKVARLLRNEALARAAGLSAATTAMTVFMGAVGQLFAYGISGEEGEDPEENPVLSAIVKNGVPEYLRGKYLHSLGKNSNNDYVFIDSGRVDPLGPVNEMLKGLIEGDPAKAGEALASQFIINSLAMKLIQPLVSDSPTKPAWSGDFNEMYELMRTSVTDMGLAPQTFDKITRMLEVVTPRTLATAAGKTVDYFHASNPTDQPGWSDAFQGLGLKLTMYNPAKSVQGAAKYEYLAPMNEARSELREYIKTLNGEGSPETIRRMYANIIATDMKGFNDLTLNVQAAKGAGMSRGDIKETLKLAGVKEDSANDISRGKYKLRVLDESIIDRWEAEELEQNGTTRSARSLIKLKYRALQKSVRNLNRELKEKK